MTLFDRLMLLSLVDALAVALLLGSWQGVSFLIEREGSSRPSVSVLMARYRHDWMKQMLTRQPRVFDASVLASLRQATSFFASTCVIAIGGVLALVGNAERLVGVAADLGESDLSRVILELKLALVALLLTDGFLKFVWANRLFGYCAVVMAAVPNEPEDPLALPRAAQAAELNIRAAANFNRGLRSIYFALAALAWLFGAWALLAAVVATLWVVWSREFYSLSHEILTRSEPMSPPRPSEGHDTTGS